MALSYGCVVPDMGAGGGFPKAKGTAPVGATR
jgi:hypothetical protein